MDSQALTLISEANVERIGRFRTDFKDKHEPIQFINKLKQWLGGTTTADDDEEYGATQNPTLNAPQVDWELLGERVRPFASQTPSMDFM